MQVFEKVKSTIGEDYTAYILIFLGNVFWFTGLQLGSEHPKINFILIGLTRGLCCFAIAYIVGKLYGFKTDLQNHNDFRVLFVRNLLMTLQGIVISVSLKYLQTPIVHTIANTGPIVVFIMDYFENHTPVSSRQLKGILLASIGLLITINAHLIMHYMGYPEQIQSKFSYIESTLFTKMLVAFVLFFVTVGWAVGIVMTKRLKHTNFLEVNMHLAFNLVIFNGLLYFVFPTPQPLDMYEMFTVIFTIGFLIGMSSFFYIAGVMTTKKSGNATIIGFVMVFFGYLVTIFRYGESLNWISMGGSSIIFAGLWLVLIK